MWAAICDLPTGCKSLDSLHQCLCVCARVLNESSSFHPNPRSFCFSSSSASRAALVSWDSSLTDRQADGSDVGDISGIQQKQSRWKSMATMTVGSGEVGGGKWVERKELQLSKDLWAQHRPESEVFIVCFLPAWCAAMLVLFKVFPWKYCCCLVFPGSH